MSADSEDGYKRTLFDQRGPEAAHFLQAASSLIIPIVAGALIGGALGVRNGYSAALVVVSAVGGSIVFAVWWWFFVTGTSHGAGNLFGAFLQPGGAGSYERQYSREDALVMRGDVEGALASYEEIILEAPTDPQPRIRAADLCAKSGLRERAEILYRSVQRLRRVASRDDIYVSNRLVDLYLAWPGHEVNGLRELRRIIDTYPESDAAKHARAGLVNLKRQLGGAE